MTTNNGEAERPLPDGWVWTTIGEIAKDINSGFPSGRHNQVGKGIPHLRPMNVSPHGEIDLTVVKYVEETDYDSLKSGDVLFNNTNSPEWVGKTTYIKQDTDWAYSNHMTRIRLYPETINSAWVAYALHYLFHTGFFKLHCSHHVNQASINRTFLSNEVSIPVAPLAEQERIVAEIEKQFTRLDTAVSALKRLQTNLARYKTAVLKAACEGRLVPQDPNDETAEKLLGRILAERRGRWEAANPGKKYQEPKGVETAELPDLPDGWVWVTWEQVGFSQNGRSFPSKQYQPNGVKLLRPGNLHVSGKIDWNEKNSRYMPNTWAEEYPDFIVGGRELVMNLTAQSLKDEFLGRVCLTGDGEQCLLNQRIARLTPILISPEYLLWLFKSQIFRTFVKGLNTGSLIQHMFTSQLAQFVFPLPPLAEQERIVAEVEQRLSVVTAVEQTITTNLARAERLRQAILHRAFTGRLVPQDPNDEPAHVLLGNIRAQQGKQT